MQPPQSSPNGLNARFSIMTSGVLPPERRAFGGEGDRIVKRRAAGLPLSGCGGLSAGMPVKQQLSFVSLRSSR